jgi:hypothetical protein
MEKTLPAWLPACVATDKKTNDRRKVNRDRRMKKYTTLVPSESGCEHGMAELMIFPNILLCFVWNWLGDDPRTRF